MTSTAPAASNQDNAAGSDDHSYIHVFGSATVKKYDSDSATVAYRITPLSPVFTVAGILEPGRYVHWGYDNRSTMKYPVIGPYEPALTGYYDKYECGMSIESNGRLSIPKTYTEAGEGIGNVDEVAFTGERYYFVACNRMLQAQWPLCYVLSHDQLVHLRDDPTDRKPFSGTAYPSTWSSDTYTWSYWIGSVTPDHSPVNDAPAANDTEYHVVHIDQPDTDTVLTKSFTTDEYQAFLREAGKTTE